jgi:hypothetical protein
VLARFPRRASWSDARCPVVNGDVVVWLVPHSFGGAFLADLGRLAVELDGGGILGSRLRLGRVGAVSGRKSPRRGRPQGRCEDSGSD